ncbi:MAG TPA: lipase family protein [Candidatus Omnitrophica bacterium]|nr:lipase family protein [Candidatus Omnitrophota bacterium]
MSKLYFPHKDLLSPPIRRAAYSDRTAWLMAVMSQLAYLIFEKNSNELKEALSQANFELVQTFNRDATQAFLVKRDSDKMAILAFRGTQIKEIKDIVTDLKANFYQDKNGAKVHNGFYQAFKCVEDDIRSAVDIVKDFSLYVTGHSLGGALALIATRALNYDNLAACYTFGSPKVGNEEFDDDIKAPIYRIVNAHDIVPFSPPTYIFELLCLLPCKKLRNFIKKFIGYDHHGDMRYLTPYNDGFTRVKVIKNYNEFFRLVGFLKNKKEGVKNHSIDAYCEKLGLWAMKRLNMK